MFLVALFLFAPNSTSTSEWYKVLWGNSLVVQWLGLCAFPGWGTMSNPPKRNKVLWYIHTSKLLHSKKKKKKKRKWTTDSYSCTFVLCIFSMYVKKNILMPMSCLFLDNWIRVSRSEVWAVAGLKSSSGDFNVHIKCKRHWGGGWSMDFRVRESWVQILPFSNCCVSNSFLMCTKGINMLSILQGCCMDMSKKSQNIESAP